MDRAETAPGASTVDRTLDEERRRLARDLHDAVGNRLTVISLQARSIDGDRALQRLASIDEVAQQAMRQMGWIVQGLRGRSAVLAEEPTGVVAAVGQAIDELGELVGHIPLRVSGDDVCPPAGVRRLARQTVHEAVINAMKHGRLRDACVELSVGDELDLRVWTRSGDGSTPRQGMGGFGLGLVGLAERAHDYGGALEAAGSLGAWFVVRVRIPLVWTSARLAVRTAAVARN